MMPEVNWLAVIVAGLIPMILGAIWYGPLLGKQWFDSLGKTEEEMVPNNMPITYGLALLAALLLSSSMKMLMETMHKELNDAGELVFGSFHTFGHGAFHGLFMFVFLIFPVILSLSLFHKMSAKNILINVAFWATAMTIMGGILDVWV